MAVKSFSRYMDNVTPDMVVKLLTKAGWEQRPRGSTSHIVLTKPGHDSITLGSTISLQQWTSLRKTVGMELKHLLNTRNARGRGNALRPEEWQQRLEFAKSMIMTGFSPSDALEYGGLTALGKVGVTPERLRTMTVPALLAQYITPYTNERAKVNPTKVKQDDAHRNGPVFHYYDPERKVVVEKPPVPDPLPDLVQAVAEQVAEDVREAEPTPTPEPPIEATPEYQRLASYGAARDEDALLSLMAEMHEEIKRSNRGATETAFRYAERLRLARALFGDIESTMHKLRLVLFGSELSGG